MAVKKKLLILSACMFLGIAASAQTDTSKNQDSIINSNIMKSRAEMELYFERRARAQYIRDSLAAKKSPRVLTEADETEKKRSGKP
jgi:hypothetical protein